MHPWDAVRLVNVLGSLPNMNIKLGPARFKLNGHAADLPNENLVLGMNFLDAINPTMEWR
jgi:hypothetical protein